MNKLLQLNKSKEQNIQAVTDMLAEIMTDDVGVYFIGRYYGKPRSKGYVLDLTTGEATPTLFEFENNDN